MDEVFLLLLIILAVVVVIALAIAILKIPQVLAEQKKTNVLLAKIARAQGVPDAEISKVFTK